MKLKAISLVLIAAALAWLALLPSIEDGKQALPYRVLNESRIDNPKVKITRLYVEVAEAGTDREMAETAIAAILSALEKEPDFKTLICEVYVAYEKKPNVIAAHHPQGFYTFGANLYWDVQLRHGDGPFKTYWTQEFYD